MYYFSGFFACNHHRAPLYFAESINTKKGFWGWPCPSYFEYLIGMCPPRDPQVIMGEHVNRTASGMYLVITESVAPYAVGIYEGPSIEVLYKSEWNRIYVLENCKKEVLNFIDVDDILENVYISKTETNDVLNSCSTLPISDNVIENY